MNKFKGATYVITGAGSGIGRELAIELAHLGADLAISDLNGDTLQETTELVSREGINVHSHQLDVSDKESVFAYADLVQEHFDQINVIINNAGVALSTGTFENTTLEEFEWLMSINFSGVLYGTKAFLPHLQRAQWGHIVNVSSLFGLIGVPGQAAYNASKFAVRGLTEALRQELNATGSKVSCTSVHPGGIKTNIALNSREGSTPPTDLDQMFLADAEEFEKLARTTAQSAATQIINAVKRNKRRLVIGGDAKTMDWIQRHFPNHYHQALELIMKVARR
ncbi:SDR family NAD(P)-dependent oxidoreductase [Arenicella sp. 4NH20-0111]|uniref:SDR family NAD(P)-dependent oxidoreductase n=1 Tax=Arenicella sp. 4NH20-0111 TaxID=3127648 RepID=UPI003104F271